MTARACRPAPPRLLAAALLAHLSCVALAAPAAAAPPAPVRRIASYLPMGTGALSGTYHPLGTAFANLLNLRLSDVNLIALSTRGSIENVRLLLDGELSLAIVQSDVFHEACRGEGDFAGRDGAALSALLSLYPEAVQVVARADAGIAAVGDLRGRRVILGEWGSGTLKTALVLLERFGIREGDLTAGYLSFDAATGALARGEWDAAVIVAGLPTRAVRDLALRLPVRVIPFDPQDAERIRRETGFLSTVAIPAGTYPGQEADVTTVALRALLVCRADLPEATAHGIVEELFAGLEYLKSAHPRAADLTAGTARDAIPAERLHPGARRALSAAAAGR